MPDTTRITQVGKRAFGSALARITHVGGWGWFRPQREVIDEIEAGSLRCYVRVGGDDVWVVVATMHGRKYLKAECDGVEPEALLGLPALEIESVLA